VKTFISAAVRFHGGSPASHWPLVRLLGVVPAALLLSGLLIVAVAPVAPVAAASGDWPQSQNGPAHDGFNGQETIISASNVHSLQLDWTADTGRTHSYTSPVVADGTVYYTGSGQLDAYAVGCASGGRSCTPLWQSADVDALGWQIQYSPAVANGVVYVGAGGEYSGRTELDAFAVGCTSGGGSCMPLWRAQVGASWGVLDIGSPTVANGVVYVGSSEGAAGKLYAFAADCASGGRTCTPLWTGATYQRADSTPAVANGVVYISSGRRLYAFAVGCASGGRACTPLWTSGLLNDNVGAPVVADGVVYVGSYVPYEGSLGDGGVYAFAVGCASGGRTCSPMWTSGSLHDETQELTVANGVVYAASMWGDAKVYALQVGCARDGGTCEPLWTANGGSAPAVANGVVYTGNANKLYAYAVGCSSGGKICTPLWTGTVGSNTGVSYVSVANGEVYLACEDGTLYAFGLPGATYHALTPARVLDSRIKLGGGLFHSQVKQTLTVTTTASGVPKSAVAVTGNLTVVGQTRGGYVTVAPHLTSGVQPPTSTINFPVGDVRANGMTVPLASGGKLDLMYWSSSTTDTVNVIFDVTGYFS
jgi:hypothetical protein